MAFSMVLLSAGAKEKKAKKSKKNQPVIEKVFNNEVDSMSYALGMNVGADFAKNLKSRKSYTIGAGAICVLV